jgi:asparagine synthase (glutamine-hydrolysing)
MATGGSVIAWEGEIFNREEILDKLGSRSELQTGISDRALFNRFLKEKGAGCIGEIDGQFAFAVFDSVKGEVLLGRDRLGIETIYIYEDKQKFVFSSSLDLIVRCPGIRKEFNHDLVDQNLVMVQPGVGYHIPRDQYLNSIDGGITTR